MKNNKNAIKISIILVVIVLAIAAYLIVSSKIDANYVPNYILEDFVKFPERTANVNEYKVSRVSKEDMAIVYFNRFIYTMLERPEEAYSLLDAESKKNIYKNIEWFNRKVAILTNDYQIMPEFDSYSIGGEGTSTIYIVKDKRNNIYTFKVDGVMKYTVTFD